MVFAKRDDKPENGFSVGVILNRKETAGDIGLEIEVEGNKFPYPEGFKGAHKPVMFPDLQMWSYVHDGSLRGNDNAEYVLTKPITFDKVPEALDALWHKLDNYGSVIAESNRTSVHVHLNCQQFHLNRLTSLMAMYFIFEEVLTEWCGEHRVGNLFCLRAKDAPAIVSQIKRFIKTDGGYELQSHLHYAGLNANALHKFGSLEFRTLRGCTNKTVIRDWVGILQRLYELSAEYPDPRSLPDLFSQSGPVAFFDTILGDKAEIVRAGVKMSYDEIAESMYDGLRLVQGLCYCRDWERFNAIVLKEDPFGRDARKIAKKMAAPAAMATIPVAPYEEYYEPEYDGDHPMPSPAPQAIPILNPFTSANLWSQG